MSDVSKTSAELIAEARGEFLSHTDNLWAADLVARLADALESATRVPEQGEASAAIERVRALAYQHRSVEQHNGMVPLSEIGDLIREPSSADYFAALDGAPEPEWEWGVRHVKVDGWVDYLPHPNRAEAEEDYRTCGMNCALVRRRKAGPWLPVKGETS